MDREILFRAKIKETYYQNIPNGWGQKDGDWVDGFYYIRTDCTCNGYEYCECEGYEQHLIADVGCGDYPIDVKTLGQYTGLKDKNGKKIFEGDIVRYPCGAEYEVFYDSETMSFRLKNETDIHCFEIDTNLDMEIIGTIFDKEGV